jgi:hypothetical protein
MCRFDAFNLRDRATFEISCEMSLLCIQSRCLQSCCEPMCALCCLISFSFLISSNNIMYILSHKRAHSISTLRALPESPPRGCIFLLVLILLGIGQKCIDTNKHSQTLHAMTYVDCQSSTMPYMLDQFSGY